MRYRLTDPDRERLGITDEWVEFDLTSLRALEAEALEDNGYEADQFIDDLIGYEQYDDQGQVITRTVDGDDGEPTEVALRRRPAKALRAAVWLAARRGGATVALAGFDYDLVGMIREADTGAGKDPEPDPASAS